MSPKHLGWEGASCWWSLSRGNNGAYPEVHTALNLVILSSKRRASLKTVCSFEKFETNTCYWSGQDCLWSGINQSQIPFNNVQMHNKIKYTSWSQSFQKESSSSLDPLSMKGCRPFVSSNWKLLQNSHILIFKWSISVIPIFSLQQCLS